MRAQYKSTRKEILHIHQLLGIQPLQLPGVRTSGLFGNLKLYTAAKAVVRKLGGVSEAEREEFMYRVPWNMYRIIQKLNLEALKQVGIGML